MNDETIEILDQDDIAEDLVVSEYEQRAFTITPLDESIIKKAINADEQAFEKVFMGTYRYVFAIARKYLKNDQDIYDAIQDTYTRVYKGLSRLESASSFYPWLYRIATNCAKDVLTNSNPDIITSFDNEINIADENQSDSADVCADVTEVLKQLPPEQSELLIRVYYDKMRVAEIARMQGVPVTTVHNRLKAAKKKLRELLKIRGIDKPIYSGEFISMISTALRNAIGTELLSMAIAEEILHNVTNSKNPKGAFVVSAFARKMRNASLKKIAAILLLTVFLTTALVILIVGIIIKSIYNGGKTTDTSSTNSSIVEHNSYDESDTSVQEIVSSSTSLDTDTSSFDALTNITSPSSNDTSPSSNDLPSDTDSNTDTEKVEPVKFLASFKTDENFGTFVENGYLGIATSGNAVYGFASASITKVEKTENSYFLSVINWGLFDDLYGETGCFMNVYDEKIYWINQNSESQFVLNRCNFDTVAFDEIDDTAHYYKVFEEFDCAFLTNMLVAKDGIYFLAGKQGDDSATLYRTDYDFNIKDTISGVADFALINDKIYYLHGKGNYGLLYSADRATFGNKTCVSPDNLNYGGISTIGEFLVLEPSNPYGHSNYGDRTDCIVIDTLAGKIVRTISVKSGDTFTVNDASDFDGGTVVYTHNGENMALNITSGEITKFLPPLGTMYGGRNYYVKYELFSCDINNQNVVCHH